MVITYVLCVARVTGYSARRFALRRIRSIGYEVAWVCVVASTLEAMWVDVAIPRPAHG